MAGFSWTSFLHASFAVLRDASFQFVAFFGVLALSAMALTFLSKWINNSFQKFSYPRIGLYVFGLIGIPVHEFCHALFAKLFFHKIESIKWFDPSAKGGSHGVVVHYYNERNIYQRIGLFFIGLGPVLLVPFFLSGAYHYLVSPASAVTFDDLKLSLSTGSNWKSAGFYVFLYFALCLTSQMELSNEDFKVARGGILPIFLILLILNSLARIFHLNFHAKVLEHFHQAWEFWSSYFIFATAVAALNFLLIWLTLNLIHKIFGRESINPFR